MEFHQTWLEEAINWLDFEWDWGGGGVRAPVPPPPSDFVYLCNNSSITSWNFVRLGGKVKYDVAINWLDFEWDYIAGGGGGGPNLECVVLLWILQECIETNYYIKDLGNNAVCERAEGIPVDCAQSNFSSLLMCKYIHVGYLWGVHAVTSRPTTVYI